MKQDLVLRVYANTRNLVTIEFVPFKKISLSSIKKEYLLVYLYELSGKLFYRDVYTIIFEYKK